MFPELGIQCIDRKSASQQFPVKITSLLEFWHVSTHTERYTCTHIYILISLSQLKARWLFQRIYFLTFSSRKQNTAYFLLK